MKGERKRTWRRRGFEKIRAESQRAQRDGRNCTLKTAQPDGKHLVKKPVANVFKDTRAQKCETILQLVSGEKARQREIFDSYSI